MSLLHNITEFYRIFARLREMPIPRIRPIRATDWNILYEGDNFQNYYCVKQIHIPHFRYRIDQMINPSRGLYLAQESVPLLTKYYIFIYGLDQIISLKKKVRLTIVFTSWLRFSLKQEIYFHDNDGSKFIKNLRKKSQAFI